MPERAEDHADEYREIRASVREFVDREVRPICDELDNKDKEIPLPVIGKMAELGYFGLIFPLEYGGMGLDTTTMAIVNEELSRGWLSVGSVMTRMLITGSRILANGTDEQTMRFLLRICTGGRRLAHPHHRIQGDAQLRAAVRSVPLPRREPPRRRGGARLLPVDGDVRVRAHPDGGARRGRGAGGARRGGEVREGTRAVRS